MDAVEESSVLSKNLNDLERDFKYNLRLLKIREEEIERCELQNTKLANELKVKQRDEADMVVKIKNLEENLLLKNKENTEIKAYFERVVDELNRSLNESKEAHGNAQKEFMKQIKIKEDQFNQICMNIIMAKEKVHKHEVEIFEIKLEKLEIINDQLTVQLHNSLNDNSTLRANMENEIVVLTIKLEDYLAQIKTMQHNLESIQEKKSNAINEANQVKVEIAQIKKENNSLSEKVAAKEKENSELKTKINQISSENDNYCNCIETMKIQLENSQQSLKKAEEKNIELIEKLQKLQQEQKDSETCRNPEHDCIDGIINQNNILKEVIKALRKERDNCSNNAEIESKLEHLENLIGKIQNSIINADTESNTCNNLSPNECDCTPWD